MSGPATSPLRVLVADDDDAFRRALTAALDGVGRVEVVGAARDGREAIELFSELAPDVVLMDIVMPRCDGIAATREILATDPGARIIALTSADDYRALALCLAAGATGCLKKDGGTLALAPLMISLHGARAPAKRTDPPPNTSDRSRSRMRASVPAIVLALGVALAAC